MRDATRSLLRFAAGALSVAAVLAIAPSVRAEDPEPEEAGTPFTGALALEGASFAGVPALCAAFIAEARAQAAAQTREALEPRRPPRCVAQGAPVQLTARGPMRAVRVLWLDDGLATRRQLALATATGTYLTWFAWDVDDPNDPGCPSIIRDVGIEQLRIEHGALVVVALGERTAYAEPTSDEDPGYRAELVRTVHWFVPGEGAPKAWFWSQTLGSKVQPAADRRVPWTSLRWQERRELHLDAARQARVRG